MEQAVESEVQEAKEPAQVPQEPAPRGAISLSHSKNLERLYEEEGASIFDEFLQWFDAQKSCVGANAIRANVNWEETDTPKSRELHWHLINDLARAGLKVIIALPGYVFPGTPIKIEEPGQVRLMLEHLMKEGMDLDLIFGWQINEPYNVGFTKEERDQAYYAIIQNRALQGKRISICGLSVNWWCKPEIHAWNELPGVDPSEYDVDLHWYHRLWKPQWEWDVLKLVEHLGDRAVCYEANYYPNYSPHADLMQWFHPQPNFNPHIMEGLYHLIRGIKARFGFSTFHGLYGGLYWALRSIKWGWNPLATEWMIHGDQAMLDWIAAWKKKYRMKYTCVEWEQTQGQVPQSWKFNPPKGGDVHA